MKEEDTRRRCGEMVAQLDELDVGYETGESALHVPAELALELVTLLKSIHRGEELFDYDLAYANHVAKCSLGVCVWCGRLTDEGKTALIATYERILLQTGAQ